MEVKMDSIIPSEVRAIVNLVECLASEIDAKNQKLEEMECKYNEISASLRKAVEEKDVLYQNYTEEMRRMQCVLHDHSLRVPQEIEKFKLVLDSRMEELAKRASELKKREMQNDLDRKKLIIEKRKNAITSQSLQTTMLQQKEAYEYAFRVLEDERNVMKIQTLRMGILERKRSCEYALRTSEDQQEIIDDEDEKLNGLKNELGEVVYLAVTTALMEINDYNPSGRFIIPELWNFREGKRATLKEAISFLLGQLKSTLKRKR
ncbi:hypothetical protein GIB67_006673 [Kingdonia uniflora]|uniref:Factor of DNA methylation 1-5/IDN2 domain-containing protein n=1 Tax=Kingdonia uniflora TaxID=39325 RepID=A0A7J7LAR1_9MAGN|nr:hypothetical protein GIB67_006673 [Kingdonia uniflora]